MKVYNDMVTRKFMQIFIWATGWIVAHWLEEILTWFAHVDMSYLWLFRPLLEMNIQDALFILYQILIWSILLIWWIFLFWKAKLKLFLLYILWVILFLELHHVVEAIIRWEYYPWMLTALLLPIIGYYYWKNLLDIRKQT
jgi:hypothetical protein